MNEPQFNKQVIEVDKAYLDFDKLQIRRTRNIKNIPTIINRRGGKLSYAEWAHVIGIFQTLTYQNLNKKTGNNILDVGCGTDLIGIASEPFIANGGKYIGLDVMKEDIDFCNSYYKNPAMDFTHFDVANPSYAISQDNLQKHYPIEEESQDLVTALSVWTHLSEKDAKFYFSEVSRVLKTGARAIITFFYLDENYRDSLEIRENKEGRFHSTLQNQWIFDKAAYDSENWFSPSWTKNPEDAIGITEEGLEELLDNSKLKLVEYHPGNWKEQPGIFFQDVLIFEKI